MTRTKLRKRIRPKLTTSLARKHSLKKYFGILFTMFGIFTFILYFRLFHTWEKTSFGLIVNRGLSADYYLINPDDNKITKITIPQSLQVEASGGYGIWTIKGLNQLAINEGLGTTLLVNTISRYVHLPAQYWIDKDINLISTNFTGVLSLLTAHDTNITVLDRILLATFLMSPVVERHTIDLEKTGYVREQMLEDGSMGFVIQNKMPNDLNLLIAQNWVTESTNKIKIIDGGYKETARKISNLMGVLGYQTAVYEETENKGECAIFANKPTSEKISRLIGCNNIMNNTNTSFAFVIQVGENLAKEY